MSIKTTETTSQALPPAEFVAGNHFDKYQSANRIHQWLMKGFLESAVELLDLASPESIVEAGCGPGDLASHLLAHARRNFSYAGIDLSEEQVSLARQTLPDRDFLTASIYELPFEDESADMTLACEVLEHVDQPRVAIDELARVTRRWALVSVPWEPVWRILNFCRGKYLASLGNTPGHVQNFTRSRIRDLLVTRFDVIEERRPLPWTMFLLKKR
ncbi:MAG: class I SAM-dependent methyltransferase [Planctomycetota bacterium]|nr:class I SAM-dependent methyltransferase [Planctomycetota bacterium]